jgi:hypothetical protein
LAKYQEGLVAGEREGMKYIIGLNIDLFVVNDTNKMYNDANIRMQIELKNFDTNLADSFILFINN